MLRFVILPLSLFTLLAFMPVISHAGTKQSSEVSLSTTQANSNGLAKSLSVDLAGIGSWGPSLDFEIGSTVAFQARLRFPNGGFLNHLFLGHESELGLSAGAGVGVRWYPLTNYFKRRNQDRRLSSLYLGVLLEYIHFHGERVAYDWHYGYLAPQAQLGYRWRKGNWIVGAGADFGAMPAVFTKRIYWNGEQREAPDIGPIPLIEGTLEIGYVF